MGVEDLPVGVDRLTWRFMGSYSGVISPPIRVISMATLLITPLITTHEPPSKP